LISFLSLWQSLSFIAGQKECQEAEQIGKGVKEE